MPPGSFSDTQVSKRGATPRGLRLHALVKARQKIVRSLLRAISMKNTAKGH